MAGAACGLGLVEVEVVAVVEAGVDAVLRQTGGGGAVVDPQLLLPVLLPLLLPLLPLCFE